MSIFEKHQNGTVGTLFKLEADKCVLCFCCRQYIHIAAVFLGLFVSAVLFFVVGLKYWGPEQWWPGGVFCSLLMISLPFLYARYLKHTPVYFVMSGKDASVYNYFKRVLYREPVRESTVVFHEDSDFEVKISNKVFETSLSPEEFAQFKNYCENTFKETQPAN